MSSYKAQFTKNFNKRQKKLKKKKPQLHSRMKRKMAEILKKPTLGKPLKGALKGRRRIHIGSYVLVYRVDREKHIIIFIEFEHHDRVYEIS